MRRDFTHIDDVARVVSTLVERSPPQDVAPGCVPARIYNVGNHRPEELTRVVALIEKELELTALKEMLPMQPGDVLETFADIQDLVCDTGFAPDTPIEEGVRGFVAWYRQHYGI